MPRKNLKNLQQTHALDETRPSTLDDIFGDNHLSKYSFSNEDEYEASLRDMNITDLQAEAYRIGLIPVQDRSILSARLMREFRKYLATHQTNHSTVYAKPKRNISLENKVKKLLES